MPYLLPIAGPLTPIGGGAVIGAGGAMIINSVTKMKEDEHMEMGDFAYNVSRGAFIGGAIGNSFLII